ncbi:MAG: class I SAM-dependent methyltransferase, partial [Myxococcales bacterium]|nr:class I SAM-dependent methyltransferase [Myxococcales bacterium]
TVGAHGVHQLLDVDTTGVLALSRSARGDALLCAAFAQGKARKIYRAVVDGAPPARQVLSQPLDGKPAETRVEVERAGDGWALVRCEPVTGRTHQIRRHLAGAGTPIRGDGRYGDALDRQAPHALLHCAALHLPGPRVFEAPAPPAFARYLGLDAAAARAGLAEDPATTCYRELDGEGDGTPGWVVDRYGDWLWVHHHLAHSAGPLPPAAGVYTVAAHPDRSRGQQPPPAHSAGAPAPEWLDVWEHGVAHRVQLGVQHLSTGIFLDQRPQRAWLARHAAGMRVLNLFAHGGAFSVAAAVGGAQTVSVDLSKQWLGRVGPSLAANGLDPDPGAHDTIYGDVFDWARRLANRGERFDLVICDPPSTSVGKRKRRWSAAKDYPELVGLLSPLVAPGGALWAATNHRGVTPARFAELVGRGAPWGAWLERVCPPAVDFPGPAGPAPVKTHVWRWPQHGVET